MRALRAAPKDQEPADQPPAPDLWIDDPEYQPPPSKKHVPEPYPLHSPQPDIENAA